MIESSVTRTSTAPVEKVFDAMTDHRALADYIWLFRRSTLDREGTPAPNGVGAVRRLTSYGTTFVEEVVGYERPDRWSYTVLSGAPVRDHLGTIELHPIDAGTEVTWTVRATPRIPALGWLMAPTFRWFLDVLLKGAIRRAEAPS